MPSPEPSAKQIDEFISKLLEHEKVVQADRAGPSTPQKSGAEQKFDSPEWLKIVHGESKVTPASPESPKVAVAGPEGLLAKSKEVAETLDELVEDLKKITGKTYVGTTKV